MRMASKMASMPAQAVLMMWRLFMGVFMVISTALDFKCSTAQGLGGCGGKGLDADGGLGRQLTQEGQTP